LARERIYLKFVDSVATRSQTGLSTMI
jgi:hypothetical protein